MCQVIHFRRSGDYVERSYCKINEDLTLFLGRGDISRRLLSLRSRRRPSPICFYFIIYFSRFIGGVFGVIDCGLVALNNFTDVQQTAVKIISPMMGMVFFCISVHQKLLEPHQKFPNFFLVAQHSGRTILHLLPLKLYKQKCNVLT